MSKTVSTFYKGLFCVGHVSEDTLEDERGHDTQYTIEEIEVWVDSVYESIQYDIAEDMSKKTMDKIEEKLLEEFRSE